MVFDPITITNPTDTSLTLHFKKKNDLNQDYKLVKLLKTTEPASGEFNWNAAPGEANGYAVDVPPLEPHVYPVTTFISPTDSSVLTALGTIKALYVDWNSVSVDTIAYRVLKWVVEEVVYAYDPAGGNWKFVDQTLSSMSGDCEDTAHLCASLLIAALIDVARNNPLTQSQVNAIVRVVVGYLDLDGDYIWDDGGHAWVVFKAGVADYNNPSASGRWKWFETTYNTMIYSNINDVPYMSDVVDLLSPLFNYRSKLPSETGTYDGVYAVDVAENTNFGTWGQEIQDTNEFIVEDDVLYNVWGTFDLDDNRYYTWPAWLDVQIGPAEYKYELNRKRFSTLVDILWASVEASYDGNSWFSVTPISFDIPHYNVVLAASYPAVRVTAVFNSIGTTVGENVIDEGTTYSFTDTGLTEGVSYYYRHMAWVNYTYPLVWGNKEGPSVVVNETTTGVPAEQPPANVTNFVVASGNQLNVLSWTNPSSDFDSFKIISSIESQPNTPDHMPIGGAPTTGASGENMSFTHNGLTNDITYYYSIFVYRGAEHSSGQGAVGMPFSEPDVTAPDPVTDMWTFGGVDGDGPYVEVSWTPIDMTALQNQDAIGYRLYVSTTSVFDDNEYVFVESPFSRAYTVRHLFDIGETPLITDTVYYFQLESIDSQTDPDANRSVPIVQTGMPQSPVGSPQQPDILVRTPSKDMSPDTFFDYVDTIGDEMTAFDFILADVPDFSHILYQGTISKLHSATDAYALSSLSMLSGLDGYPPPSAPSGMSATWYRYTISQSLNAGSYFLKIRTRDVSGKYSDYGISSFVLDNEVVGVQIIVREGMVVNTRNINVELRAPTDVLTYQLTESESFSGVDEIPYRTSSGATEGLVSPSSNTFEVEITGSGFNPSILTVNKGDRVKWINNSEDTVAIVEGIVQDLQKYPVEGGLQIDVLPGTEYLSPISPSNRFDTVGTFNYYNDIDFSKIGIVDVLDYTHVKVVSWSLSSGVGTKYLYAQFKDALDNYSEPVETIVILAIPDLKMPGLNEPVKSTLPVFEWTVPQSANGHNIHFMINIYSESNWNEDPPVADVTAQSAVDTIDFRYRETDDGIWLPFPVSGIVYDAGLDQRVRYIVNQQLAPNTKYYWKVSLGA